MFYEKKFTAGEERGKSETQIRNFAAHLNKMMEEERANIAREVHDELGQQLVGIKIGLSSLKNNPPEPRKKLEKKINGMMKDVDFTIQSLRKIGNQLRPGILDSLGLIPSIKWLAREFEKKNNIKCKIKIEDTLKEEENIFPRKNHPMSITFFRICQEALTNVSKHAKASKVRIEIEHCSLPKYKPAITRKTNARPSKQLILRISDNGKGIARKKLENPFSMGLLGMRERANLIGGELKITSKKNKGATVELKTNLV